MPDTVLPPNMHGHLHTVVPPPYFCGPDPAQQTAEWYAEQARDGKLLRTSYAGAVTKILK